MKCPDCAVALGEMHIPGCDLETCPRCGRQAISCDCIYAFCGMDPLYLEEEYPEIYMNGPTAEMYARWDATWAARRIPWLGLDERPDSKAAIRWGWYAKFIAGQGWIRCGPDEPGAGPDLNRVQGGGARWDPETQEWLIR